MNFPKPGDISVLKYVAADDQIPGYSVIVEVFPLEFRVHVIDSRGIKYRTCVHKNSSGHWQENAMARFKVLS